MPRLKKFSQEDLLKKSMILFWEKGYANTSLKDLELALQLKAPSIYHNFHSKEGLFLQSLDFYIHTILDRRIEIILNQTGNPIDNIRHFFVTTYDFINSKKPGKGCLLTNIATEFGDVTNSVSEKLRVQLNKIEQAFYQELVRAKAISVITPEADENVLAKNLLISFEGILVICRLNYSVDELNERVESIIHCLPLVD